MCGGVGLFDEMPMTLFPKCRKNCRNVAKAALLLAFSLAMPGAFADNELDEQTLALITKLSTNPQLINETYLSTVLGNPTTSAGQPGAPSNKYWYKQGTKGPKYELTSYDEPDGKHTTTFVINDPSRELDFEDVEKLFGNNPLRRFDQQARPMSIYSFNPNTSLIFTKPQNTFRVEKISVNYAGPPLPPPSVFDVQAASDVRKQQILDMHAKGLHWESLPTLWQHVKENPGDAEMHYHLARAYKQSCFINQAVAEYSNALYLCVPGTKENEDLAKKCMDGLAELKMHPLTPEQLKEYHNYALFQNEQRLKQGANIANRLPGVKHPKLGPYDAIEELDPPAHHFLPGTLIPRSSVAETAGMPQTAPSFNLVPLKATQGVLKLDDLKGPNLGALSASVPAAAVTSLTTGKAAGAAGVTLMPNGEPF
jgi:hypothetical protein